MLVLQLKKKKKGAEERFKGAGRIRHLPTRHSRDEPIKINPSKYSFLGA
jgi:hypothetical protein